MTHSAPRESALTTSAASIKKGSARGITADAPKSTPVRVLAVASGGGHWVQLLRMRPSWEGCDVAYATTHADYEKEVHRSQSPVVSRPRFYTFPDANRQQKLRLVYQLLM